MTNSQVIKIYGFSPYSFMNQANGIFTVICVNTDTIVKLSGAVEYGDTWKMIHGKRVLLFLQIAKIAFHISKFFRSIAVYLARFSKHCKCSSTSLQRVNLQIKKISNELDPLEQVALKNDLPNRPWSVKVLCFRTPHNSSDTFLQAGIQWFLQTCAYRSP